MSGTIDPDELRARERDHWERSAGGWKAAHAAFQAATEPVSRWLVDTIAPRPGMTVLELAAGLGETGFLAAERIRPGGKLITTDGAEAMLDGARERAGELGLGDDVVEFKPVELEWIDLPTASVDAVLCRWGLMLALDHEAALRETRRVLRPGGRVALATWAEPARNPTLGTARRVLYDAGLIDTLQADGPGPFDLSDADELRALLEACGFFDATVQELALTFRFDDAAAYLARSSQLSRAFADLVEGLNERQLTDLHERLEAALAPFATATGELALPAVALGATAEA